MGEPLPPTYPLYGRDAHRTRAGVHADGLNKFWWMYAPFNVPALLGRPLEVSLTKDSGLAGLIFLIRQHLGIDLPKDHPSVIAAYEWVTEQFEYGRQTSIGDCLKTGPEACWQVDTFSGHLAGAQSPQNNMITSV